MVLDQLAQDCSHEFAEFKRQLETVCPACFKLFRLAFLEDRNEAFEHLYRIYDEQLKRWILYHAWFEKTGESLDYFTSAAWTKFYYATRRAKFEDFQTIAQIMAYLKRCVHSAIAQHIRKAPPPSLAFDDLEEAIEDGSSPLSSLATQDVWQRICGLLPDPRQQRLAEYIFYKDMKPAEIFKIEPDTWQSVERIYKEVWHIRSLLRNDPQIKRLLSSEDD